MRQGNRQYESVRRFGQGGTGVPTRLQQNTMDEKWGEGLGGDDGGAGAIED